MFQLRNFVCFLIVFYGSQSLFGYMQLMQQSPKKEFQVQLTHFFRCDGFGYTLIGAKAVSLECYAKNFLSFNSIKLHDILMHLQGRSTTSLTDAWDQFLAKYGKFNNEEFILLENEQDLIQNARTISLIHKKKFLEVVNKNIDLFKKHLGNISGKDLLDRIEKRDSSFMTSLQFHLGLFSR